MTLPIPIGDTGLEHSYFDLSNWTPSTKYTLPASLDSNISSLFDLRGNTGVYTMHSNPSGQFCIGSTTNFDSRFINHYADSIDVKLSGRPLYAEVLRVNGFDNFL